MRAFDPEVVDVVWRAVEPLLPAHLEHHPPGCHRPRSSDRDGFEVMLVRLVTGCSWVDAETLTGGRVSDTTARTRRDEWVSSGLFDRLVEAAISAYDKIVGLDLSEVAIDGAIHKARGGAEGTGPNPTDRGRPGWKWSLATDFSGIPVGRATDSANRHDQFLLLPTLAAVAARGLDLDIETVHLDRGYDTSTVRQTLRSFGITDACIPKKRSGPVKKKVFVPEGSAGPSNARTPGWPTSVSCGATPTAGYDNASPSSPWLSPYSSPPSSSTGAIDGASPGPIRSSS